jgi:hypothetical protein
MRAKVSKSCLQKSLLRLHQESQSPYQLQHEPLATPRAHEGPPTPRIHEGPPIPSSSNAVRFRGCRLARLLYGTEPPKAKPRKGDDYDIVVRYRGLN